MTHTCFIPCVADPSWSLTSRFLLCYHCHVIASDISVACLLLTHVYHPISCMLSPDHLACYHLIRPCYIMTYPDYYQPFDMLDCLLNIITLSCYHFTPSMIYLTCDYLLYGNLTYSPVSWSVTCFPALHAVTWLYSTYVLQISWSCPDSIFPVKW